MPKNPTKTVTLLKLLARPQGATIAQLQKPTGWQPRSVRAALTGFRKKGHELTRKKNGAGVTAYRIAGDANR